MILLLPCDAGEVAAKPTEGACRADVGVRDAPPTRLRRVPLPRFSGRRDQAGVKLRGPADDSVRA